MMIVEVHPIYKHLQKEQRALGLELMDLFGVVLVFGLSLILVNKLWLGFILAISFHLTLWIVKRGKPTGWTQAWLGFWIQPRRYKGGADLR